MISYIVAGVVVWTIATSLSMVNERAVGWPLGLALIVGSLLWAVCEGYFTGPNLVDLSRLIKRSRRTAQAESIYGLPELSDLVGPEPALFLEALNQSSTIGDDSSQPQVAYS